MFGIKYLVNYCRGNKRKYYDIKRYSHLGDLVKIPNSIFIELFHFLKINDKLALSITNKKYREVLIPLHTIYSPSIFVINKPLISKLYRINKLCSIFRIEIRDINNINDFWNIYNALLKFKYLYFISFKNCLIFPNYILLFAKLPSICWIQLEDCHILNINIEDIIKSKLYIKYLYLKYCYGYSYNDKFIENFSKEIKETDKLKKIFIFVHTENGISYESVQLLCKPYMTICYINHELDIGLYRVNGINIIYKNIKIENIKIENIKYKNYIYDNI
jgi:hypothetical protein